MTPDQRIALMTAATWYGRCCANEDRTAKYFIEANEAWLEFVKALNEIPVTPE